MSLFCSRLQPEMVAGLIKPLFTRSIYLNSQSLSFKKLPDEHVYRNRNLYPWISQENLADELYKNIVFNQGNIIAINKPYGVPVHIPKEKHDAKDASKVVSEVGECKFNLEETLPFLERKLNLKYSLKIIKSTDRYCSGLTLLTSTSSTADAIKTSIRRGDSLTEPCFTYQAITSNIPVDKRTKIERVGIRLEDVPEMKMKAAVIVNNYTNKARQRREVRAACAALKTVAVNNIFNAALVELSTTLKTWHFVRVYLSHRLAPVLGDALHGARVKTVLGKAVALNPQNRACYGPPELSEKLCDRLLGRSRNVLYIPAHVHLHQITLSGFDRGKDLVIKAAPQPFFLWTAQQLEILPEAERE